MSYLLARFAGSSLEGSRLHGLHIQPPLIMLHQHGRHRAVLSRHAVGHQRLEEHVLLLGMVKAVGIVADEIDAVQVELPVAELLPLR